MHRSDLVSATRQCFVLAFVPLLALLGLAVAAPGAQAAGASATFTKTSDWGNGFVGDFVIRNDGASAITGWRVEFDLPARERITSAWSGKLSASGDHYVLTDESWTRTIPAGGSVKVGFQGTYSGSFAAPANCKLNGGRCGGGANPPPPDTTPPTAPTGLVASEATDTSIRLSWNASSDAVGVTGYAVFDGSTQVATTSSPAATVSGLSPSTTYSFRARAIDAAGNLSPASRAVSASTTAAPSGFVTATFAKSSDWGGGFVADYVIRNGGTSPISGWKLEFDLPVTARITGAWSAKLSSSGDHYELAPEEWTWTIAPGASVKLGFEGTYSGSFTAPSDCRLNGQPCAKGGSSPPPDTSAPSAPTGLAAGSPTASSIRLDWNASSDDVGVAGYRVYRGSTQVATTTATAATVTGLAPSTVYRFTVRAVDAAGNLSSASNRVTVSTTAASGGDGGSGATPPSYAPYVDMTLTSESLAEMMHASGTGKFSLAFIVSGAPCTASWGGYYGLEDPVIKQRIDELKAAGGDAIVSFGGAINQELANTCTSVPALAAQYQAVIDRYGIRDLDFDIEGADQSNTASLERRMKAIAQVQAVGRAAGKPVRISLTLPVMPSGLTHAGLGVVRAAIENGVEVGTVNVMAMDYFDPSLSPYDGKLGDYAIEAATATHDQLAALYPGKSDGALWRMVGVTPMIGINDNPEEVFTTADATKLTAFAKQQGLGRLAIWSINRDKPCPTPSPWTSNHCSGVDDRAWAFSHAFQAFES
jgi:chitodextrinase